ncbi:hypothetical protein SAMN04515667_2361 [Formosa sp. Hel1_31_208]|uniref:hypothetical protein n=1 Tax=Formosa sp. Hel1_31_208 TaxID=1798225 RepID=UPI00087A6845|nr:hypothetical protein [Formosa sp. Hel1_31_208]SDS52143.1 hypothetical protein SAMN04515667_2361 [Formosa sp. Hel1_31_208]
MKTIRLLLVLILPIISQAQTIKGFVYDAEATIKGARLVNTTQNTLNYSNDKGYFKVPAKLNDTLAIFSYFHFEKILVVKNTMFNEDIVIELQKITNQLDQVNLKNINEKKFDSLVFKRTTAKQGQVAFRESIISSGTNYQPTLDVMALAKVIGKLFKKKNKTLEIIYASADDLENLFNSSSLFTQDMLVTEFKIKKDYQYLFFDYCSAQNINIALITNQKDVELLDLINTYSKAFHKILEDHKK